MVERRDVEFAIRAKDLSSADLKKVEQAVRSVTDSLEDQVRAARKGEISASELQATLRQLKEAGEALANQQGLIDTYNRLSKALGDAEKNAESAKTALAEFASSSTAAVALTDKQVAAQTRLQNKVNATAAEYREAADKLATLNAAIAASETVTKKQTNEQARLQASLNRAGDASDKAANKLREFGESVQKIATANQVAQVERLQQAVVTTGEAVDRQRAKVQAAATALETAGIESNDLAAAQQRIIATANQVGAASTTTATALGAYATNAREAAEAAKALADQNRQVAALARIREQAQLTATAYTTLAEAQRGVTSTEARDAVAGQTDRTAAAFASQARTLPGLSEVAAQSQATVTAIEKATGPVVGYIDTLQQLERAISRANSIAGKIDGYRTQASATDRARGAAEDARREYLQLDAALAAAGNATQQQANELNRAAETSNRASAAYAQQRARLAALGQELSETGVDTRNLAQEQQRLATVAGTSAEAIRRLNAEIGKRGVREGDNFAILGLRPFELQNLSFQVNDFFTQIASGTSVTQAFAQQIGQVIQIGRIGPALLSALPAVVTLTAALVPLIASLARVVEQARLLREANVAAALGGVQSGQGIVQAAEAARRLGVSFTDARAAAIALSRLPLPVADYQRLSEAVASYGQAIGDGKRASEEFLDAFTRGVPGIIELDNRLRVLTQTQRDNLLTAQTQEQQTRAVSEAIGAFASRADEARRIGATPLGDAVIRLGNAWRDLLDRLAQGGTLELATRAVRGLTAAVDTLGRALSNIGSFENLLVTLAGAAGGAALGARVPLPGPLRLATAGIGAVAGGVAANRDLARPNDARRAARRPGAAQDPEGGVVAADEAATAAQAVADAERARADAIQRRDETELRNINTQIQIRNLDRQIAAGVERRATAAERAASIEAAANKVAAERRSENIRENRAPELGVALLAEEARAEQRRRIQEAQQKAAESAGRAAVTERRRELAEIEGDIRAVDQVRSDQIRTIQEDVARGSITAVEGLQRIQQAATDALPRYRALAEEAKRFADANRGQPGLTAPRADALAASAQRRLDVDGTRGPANELLRAEQQKLQQAVQERSQFIQTINALEQQGAITTSEAQRRITEAYALTNGTIQAQITALSNLVTSLQQTGQISDITAAQIRASIQLAEAQLVRVNPQLAAIRQAFETSFTGGAISGLNQVAEAIGNLVTGMGDFRDVTEAAGRAVLSTFAGILRAIAEAILKQQILNAVQAVSGFLGLANPLAAAGGAAAGAAVNVGSRRLGGFVGMPAPQTRKAQVSWFRDAPRYQNGGFPGLRADEEAAILHRGEEVLTKDDPRNALNMAKNAGQGGAAPSEIGIRNVLVMDPAMLAEALSGADGERVVVQTLRKNAATLRQLVR